jgi:hypothetical protein
MKQPISSAQLAVGAGFGLLVGLVSRFDVPQPPPVWTPDTLWYLAGSAIGGAALYAVARLFVKFVRPKD